MTHETKKKKLAASNSRMRKSLNRIDYFVNCAIADSYLLGAEDDDGCDIGRTYQVYSRALGKIATEVRDLTCMRNYWHAQFVAEGVIK